MDGSWRVGTLGAGAGTSGQENVARRGISFAENQQGRSPRVFCDKFVTKFVTKFGDKFSESPNLVINFWPKLVTNVVINCIQ